MQAGELFDLAGHLARYRATYPGIGLKLRQAGSAELGRLLRDGAVEMVFATAVDEPTPISCPSRSSGRPSSSSAGPMAP